MWNGIDDILATHIVDLLFFDEFRAHNDGVFQCINGGWSFV